MKSRKDNRSDLSLQSTDSSGIKIGLKPLDEEVTGGEKLLTSNEGTDITKNILVDDLKEYILEGFEVPVPEDITSDDVENLSSVMGDDVTQALDHLLNIVEPPLLSGLTYSGRVSYLKSGASISNLEFIWSVSGGVKGTILKDSLGQMGDVSIPEGSVNYTGIEAYTSIVPVTITWTLTDPAAGVSDTINTQWVYPSYWGLNQTGLVPDEPTAIAGNEMITATTSSVTITPSNAPEDFIWWAIPVTGSPYTTWFNVVGNEGLIGPAEFVRQDSNLDIGGVAYEIYITNSPSAVEGTLKLE